MKKSMIAVAIGFGLTGSIAEARDLGFRYVNGRCVNPAGAVGLNPGFLGQCADLRHVLLGNFDLSDIDFSGSMFGDSDMQGSIFNGSNLTGTDFSASELDGADFGGATVMKASFKGASLVNSHWATADIQDTVFSGADLSNTLLSYTAMPGCVFAGAKLAGATVDHMDFHGADLRGVNLSGLNLSGASFARAQIAGTDFSGADLNKTSFSEASGAGVIFRGAVLRGAKLEHASLISAVFRGAQMDGVSLAESDLSRADLRGVKMATGSVENTNFTGALFSSTSVLPFTADVAKAKGMEWVKQGLLVIWDEKNADVDALVAFLSGQGLSVTLSTQDSTAFDGSQKLFDYTAVLHLLGSDRVIQHNVPYEGQEALRTFVERGGTYVATQWISYMADVDNLLRRMRDLVLLGLTARNFTSENFNPSVSAKGHPILAGINSSILVQGAVLRGKMHTFDRQPAVSLMQADDGSDVVAAREYGLGKVVNFAFASSYDLNDNSSHILQQPSIQRLILNAVEW